MARPRQPIELVLAKGKKNLTKAEIEQRRAQEVKVDFKNVTPPDYLPAKLRKDFEEIAKKLLAIGIMTELDEDCLARYLIAQSNYLNYTKLLAKAMRSENMDDIIKAQRAQDVAFRQCQSAANALGLTISSRCKLVMPQVEVEQSKNKFDRFRSG